jgi:hypothetical protein
MIGSLRASVLRGAGRGLGTAGTASSPTGRNRNGGGSGAGGAASGVGAEAGGRNSGGETGASADHAGVARLRPNDSTALAQGGDELAGHALASAASSAISIRQTLFDPETASEARVRRAYFESRPSKLAIPTSLLGPSMMAEILALSSAEADARRVIKDAENIKTGVKAKRVAQVEASALLLGDLDLAARVATASFVEQSAIPEPWRRILGSFWFKFFSAAGLISLLASIITKDVMRRKREQRDMLLWD